MGSDKHFHEDHCYLDDSADSVGMNVEIIEDKIHQVVSNSVSDEKPVMRYLDISGGSNSRMSNDSCEETSTSSRNALVYLPYNEYCTDHADMFLLEDEKLVKPGDKFDSHVEFVQYLNENAKRWYFYYKCSDSRKPNTEYETYTYNCVYLRNKEKYKKKGLRKRNNNTKTDCPCKIKLRHLPNEKELTVVYVCNHHDHELSLEEFYKLQHGRRLPPYVKEEIMDFLQLKLDVMKIRAYVEMETGFSMSRPFFYALEKNLKSKSEQRQITAERLVLLKKKIAAVNEIYGFNESENTDDQAQHIEEHPEDSEASWKSKHRRLKNSEGSKTPPLKRSSKANDVVISSDDAKRSRLEEVSENSSHNETFESVKNLQESVKCEIQRNPWVADQCVPVLPNRTAIQSECEDSILIETVEHLHEDVHSEAQNEMEPLSYTIEYYNSDDNSTQETINNEFDVNINDGQVNESAQNDIDNIAYETIVTEVITENDGEPVQEYVNDDQIMNERVEIQIGTQDCVNEDMGTTNDDVNNTQDVEEESHVDYVIEDNEDVVQYIDEIQDENNAQDVAVQTANSSSSENSLLPVFDVYMKDGNVTGFVVNNNLVGGLKYGVDIGIQTSEDDIISETQDLETRGCDGEIIHVTTNSKSGNTYTKHEYVHNYNIHKYMVLPYFPKYVETLAKKTDMDVLTMFTNIYNEKAMFKITTTQKGKEGNTRIWYITDIPRLQRQRNDEGFREKMGRQLESAFVLKEKVRMLKKHNRQLLSRNKKLEDVALRLVKLT